MPVELSRRFVLLLPLALAACGGDDETVYEPLRYTYLPPIQLNVASIEVQQRYFPSGQPPDATPQDPAPPVDALKAMANDRLQAFGTSGKAVFAIQEASLTRSGDVITGRLDVTLSIFDNDGTQRGFAEAHVEKRRVGRIDDLPAVLYGLTKDMMSSMNIEFEYQIRQHLKNWLTSSTAPDAPVQQTPLDQNGNPITPPPDQSAPPGAAPPSDGSLPPPTPLSPPALSPPPAMLDQHAPLVVPRAPAPPDDQ